MPNLNYNKKLLTAINNVSAGNSASITIYYKDNSRLLSTEISNALEQWSLFFNTLYASSKTNGRSGDLTLYFEVETDTNKAEIIFSDLDKSSSRQAVSYFIHQIGLFLGYKLSRLNTPMNPLHLKLDYVFLSGINATEEGSIEGNGLITYQQLIADTYKLYGNPNIANPIIYGCTDSKALNYDALATVSADECIYEIGDNANIKSPQIPKNYIQIRGIDIFEDSSNAIQFSSSKAQYYTTQDSVYGPKAYVSDLTSFSNLNLSNNFSESINDYLPKKSSSILTDINGNILFTSICNLDSIAFVDRLGNYIANSNVSSYLNTLPSAYSELQDINSNIITFGDIFVSGYARVDNQGYITIHYLDSRLNNTNSDGEIIVDCRQDGVYGNSLGGFVGVTLMHAGLFGHKQGTLNLPNSWDNDSTLSLEQLGLTNESVNGTGKFSIYGSYFHDQNTVPVHGSNNSDNGYYKSNLLYLTNCFSSSIGTEDGIPFIHGARFDKFLHFDVYSNNYIIYNIVTLNGKDNQSLGDLVDLENISTNSFLNQGAVEYCEPYIYDSRLRKHLYNRKLTIGSYDSEESNLVYSRIKGFSFTDTTLGFYKALTNKYNFETFTFSESDDNETLPWELSYRPQIDEFLSQAPIVRSNRRRSLQNDYGDHFNSKLAEHAPLDGSIEEYSTGMYLVAYGTVHGFIIMSMSAEGIFIPPGDGGVEIHLAGGPHPTTGFQQGLAEEQWDLFSEFKGLRPISACFSRHDNFLFAILEGADASDRYLMAYNMSNIQSGATSETSSLDILSNSLLIPNPLSSTLTRIELDNYDNIFIFGEDNSDEYLKIPGADYSVNIRTAFNHAYVSNISTTKDITPSLTNNTSIYTNIKHHVYENQDAVESGELSLGQAFITKGYGVDIHSHDYPLIYNVKDNVIVENTNIVLEDLDVYPKHPYPAVMNLYSSETPTLFTADGDLLLFSTYTLPYIEENSFVLHESIISRYGNVIYNHKFGGILGGPVQGNAFYKMHGNVNSLLNSDFEGLNYRGQRYSRLIDPMHNSFFLESTDLGVLHYFTADSSFPVEGTNTSNSSNVYTRQGFGGKIVSIEFKKSEEQDISPSNITEGQKTIEYVYSMWHNLLFPVGSDSYLHKNVVPRCLKLNNSTTARATGFVPQMNRWPRYNHFSDSDVNLMADAPIDNAKLHTISGDQGTWIVYMNNPNPNVTHLNSSIGNAKIGLHLYDSSFKMEEIFTWDEIINPYSMPNLPNLSTNMSFSTASNGSSLEEHQASDRRPVKLEFSQSVFIEFSELLTDTYPEEYNYASIIDHNDHNSSLNDAESSGYRVPVLNDLTVFKSESQTGSDKDSIALNFHHYKPGLPIAEPINKTFIYGNILSIGSFNYETGSIIIDQTIPIEKVISEHIYGVSGMGNISLTTYQTGDGTSNFWSTTSNNIYNPFNGDGSVKGKVYNFNIDCAIDNIVEVAGEHSTPQGVSFEMWPGEDADKISSLQKLRVQDEVNYYPFVIKDMCFSTNGKVLYILISYNGTISHGPSTSNYKYKDKFQDGGFGDRIYKIGLEKDDSGKITSYHIKEVPVWNEQREEKMPADFDYTWYIENFGKAFPHNNLTTRSPYQDITKLYRGANGFIYIGIVSREDKEKYTASRGRILNQDSYQDSAYALYINRGTTGVNSRTENHSYYESLKQDSQFSHSSINTNPRNREDYFTYIETLVDESQLGNPQSGCTDPDACNYCPDCQPCVTNGWGGQSVFNGCCNHKIMDCGCCPGTIVPEYPLGPCGDDVGGCGCGDTYENAWNNWQMVSELEGADDAEGIWADDNLSLINANAPECITCSNPNAPNYTTPYAGQITHPGMDGSLCNWPGVCGDPGACDYVSGATSYNDCQSPSVGNITNWLQLFQSNSSNLAFNGSGLINTTSNWNLSMSFNPAYEDYVHWSEDGSGHATFLHCECNGSGSLQPMDGWCGSCGSPGVSGSPTLYSIDGEELNTDTSVMSNYGNMTIYPENDFCYCNNTKKPIYNPEAQAYWNSLALQGIDYTLVLIYYGSATGQFSQYIPQGNPMYSFPGGAELKYCTCDGKVPNQLDSSNVACDCDGNFLEGDAYYQSEVTNPFTGQLNGSNQLCNCKGQTAADIAGVPSEDYLCDCNGDWGHHSYPSNYCTCTGQLRMRMYPDLDGDGIGECYSDDPNQGGELIVGGGTGNCDQCWYTNQCPDYYGTGQYDFNLPPGYSVLCGDNCTEDVDECGVCGGPGIPEGDCDCNGNTLDCAEVCGGTSILDQGVNAETYTSEQYQQEEDSDESTPVPDGEYVAYIAALDPLPDSYIWGQHNPSPNTLQTSPLIGMGELSSINILNDPNVTPLDGTINAAQACDAYSADGTNHGVTTTYTDWFLPSAYELRELQTAKINGYTILNNEPNNWVWSSSSNGTTTQGGAVWFSMYQLDMHGRSSTFNVIPIRTETLAYTPSIGSLILGGVVFYVEGALRRNSLGKRMLSGEAYCCEASSQMIYYYDSDGDGLGDPTVSLVLCPDNPITDTGGCTGAGCYVQNNDDPDDTCDGAYDQCGVCNGNNECVDCAGVANGTSEVDECGICYENGSSNSLWNTTCADCHGDPNGDAYSDDCGNCVEGNTGLLPGYAKNRCGVCDVPDPVYPNCCADEQNCVCEGEGGMCIPIENECSQNLGCGCGGGDPDDYPCALCQDVDSNGCCPGFVYDNCKAECVPVNNPLIMIQEGITETTQEMIDNYTQSIPNPCNPDECIYPQGDGIDEAFNCTYCTDPEAINYLKNCAGQTMEEASEGMPVFDSGCCDYAQEDIVEGEVDLTGEVAPYLETAIVALPKDYVTATLDYGIPIPALLRNPQWAEWDGTEHAEENTGCYNGANTVYEETHPLYVELGPGDYFTPYYAHLPHIHAQPEQFNGMSKYTLYNASGTDKCQVATFETPTMAQNLKIYIDNAASNADVTFNFGRELIKKGWWFDIYKTHMSVAGLPFDQSDESFFNTQVQYRGARCSEVPMPHWQMDPIYDTPGCESGYTSIGTTCSDPNYSEYADVIKISSARMHFRDWSGIGPYNAGGIRMLLTTPEQFANPLTGLPLGGGSYYYKPYFYFRLDESLELTTYDPNVLFAAYADKIEKVERLVLDHPNSHKPTVGFFPLSSYSEDTLVGQGGVGDTFYIGELERTFYSESQPAYSWGKQGELNYDYFKHYTNPNVVTVYDPVQGIAQTLNKGQRYEESLELFQTSSQNNLEYNHQNAYWVYRITPKDTGDYTYEEFVIDLSPFVEQVPDIGVCLGFGSPNAINLYDTADGTNILYDLGLTLTEIQQIMDGEHSTYYVDNTICLWSNCSNVFEQVCCQDGFTNSIQNDGLTVSDIGVYGSIHECKECNANACDPLEVCTDQTAIQWINTQPLTDAGIEWEVNNDLCVYPEVILGNLRIDLWLNLPALYEELNGLGLVAEEEISRLEWLIYGTQQNIMLKSPNVLSVDPGEDGVVFYSVPLTGLPSCSWFLPLGVDEAIVWRHTILQINSGPLNNPSTHFQIVYGLSQIGLTSTSTPGGSISLKTTSVGGCTTGCEWGGNDLVTEHCVYNINNTGMLNSNVQEDVDEFTELYLEIDTSYSQDNPDAYKCSKVDIINISTNEVIVGQHGFDHNSQVTLEFNITETTKIGIKVINNPCSSGDNIDNLISMPIKYTLKTEDGNTITTKTIY